MKPLTDKQVREIIANEVAAFNTAIQTLTEEVNYIRARERRLQTDFAAIKKGVKELETYRVAKDNYKANREGL
jgi:hypothetical protein